jgi:hypothetical protein
MVRRCLEDHVTIVLNDGEDEEVIPDSFRHFIMLSLTNGNFQPLDGEHIYLSESTTGLGAVNHPWHQKKLHVQWQQSDFAITPLSRGFVT